MNQARSRVPDDALEPEGAAHDRCADDGSERVDPRAGRSDGATPDFTSLREFLRGVYGAANARETPRVHACPPPATTESAVHTTGEHRPARAAPGERPTETTGRSGTYLLERLRTVNTQALAEAAEKGEWRPTPVEASVARDDGATGGKGKRSGEGE